MKSTMVEFVDELKKLPHSAEVACMIEEAKAGEYHDYKNKKYVCGKIAAVGKLKSLGHFDLAMRIANGEFDEQADEEDIKMMSEELGVGPTADALRDALGLSDED